MCGSWWYVTTSKIIEPVLLNELFKRTESQKGVGLPSLTPWPDLASVQWDVKKRARAVRKWAAIGCVRFCLQWKQEDCLYEAFNLTHFLFWCVFKSTFTGELIVYFNYSIWFQTWTCIINNNTLLALFLINIVLEKYKIIIYNIEYMAMMVNWFIKGHLVHSHFRQLITLLTNS